MDTISLQFWTILGPIGILFFFAIKEFFTYLKAKKINGSTDSMYSKIAADKIGQISENHLVHIEEAINNGNDRIIEAINENGKILSRIDGKLSK